MRCWANGKAAGKMNRKTIIILLAIFFLAGCEEKAACEKPFIETDSGCCMDADGSNLCDDFQNRTLFDGALTPVPEHPSISLEALQDRINRTYYPIKIYTFIEAAEDNLSGFEDAYMRKDAGRFRMYVMKKEGWNLSSAKEYASFVGSLYDLRVQKNNLAVISDIGQRQITDPSWEGATYSYDHQLIRIGLLGSSDFYHYHTLLISSKNQTVKDIQVQGHYTIRCSPQIVMEIYPAGKFQSLGLLGKSVEDAKKAAQDYLEGQKGEMRQRAEEIAGICRGEFSERSFHENELIFYGSGGFYPKKLRIALGNVLLIHNENDQKGMIALAFIRQKTLLEKNTTTLISREILPEKMGNITLPARGNYTFSVDGFREAGAIEVY